MSKEVVPIDELHRRKRTACTWKCRPGPMEAGRFLWIGKHHFQGFQPFGFRGVTFSCFHLGRKSTKDQCWFLFYSCQHGAPRLFECVTLCLPVFTIWFSGNLCYFYVTFTCVMCYVMFLSCHVTLCHVMSCHVLCISVMCILSCFRHFISWMMSIACDLCLHLFHQFPGEVDIRIIRWMIGESQEAAPKTTHYKPIPSMGLVYFTCIWLILY